MRIEKLKTNYDVTVKLVHFPLHPDTPEAGVSLDVLFAGSKAEERAARQERMTGLMKAEGLPYGERTHTYNSRLAQELGLWADTQSGGDQLHALLYRRYFVHNGNLAEPEVLLTTVAEAGLDVAAAKTVLAQRTFRDACDEAWERARRFQISGVPTFAAGGYQFSGFHPLAEMEEFFRFLQEKTSA